jgi:nucleoside-diphosphate-sugar epimerase
MKILLSGSSGFLGNQIFSKIISDHLVFDLNRSTGCYKIDLVKTIPKLEEEFDLVIHNAGKAHLLPKTKEEKEIFFKVNVLGTANLLKGLEKKIPKQFVFISSVSVYGLQEGFLINENASLASKEPYGLSKIQAENILIDWCQKNSVVLTILRLPLVVGINPPGNLGTMIKGISKCFYFNIAGGAAKKSMVLGVDVANHILKAAEIGGIYNLTDGYHPSFLELSENISVQLGKRKPLNMPIWLATIIAMFGDLIGNKAPLNNKKLMNITSNLTFDDTKARDAFGWDPTPVLQGFKI